MTLRYLSWRHLVFLSGSLLACGMLLPATAQAEPLKELLGDLSQNHPRIAAARAAIASSQAGLDEARAGYLPKVDLLATTGREENDRTELETPAGETELHTSNVGLTVTQNLFAGFGTDAAFNTADTTISLAEHSLNATRQEVLLEGITAYLDVMRQVQLTELALENQETLKKQLHLEDEKVQRGSGIAVDVLQAKSRLQISKERYSAFLGGLKDAASRFNQVFGHPPEIQTMTLPVIPTPQLPASLDEAIGIAKSSNPSLLASMQGAEIAGLARTSARAGYFPSIDVVGSSNYDDNQAGIRGEETSNSILVRASWQLFSGLADKAREERATHDYQGALDLNLYTERKIEEEVKLAWSAVVTSRERAELLENAVNIAGEVFDARTRLRDAGSDTALNVLDAENELFRAKIDATAARYDYYTAVYRLLQAMGLLSLDNA